MKQFWIRVVTRLPRGTQEEAWLIVTAPDILRAVAIAHMLLSQNAEIDNWREYGTEAVTQ